ncbi:MAG: ferrochelatase [Rhodospirillales bacterium]|nr:MAG: ferrochelatase [Rhodospirillales bacterium]
MAQAATRTAVILFNLGGPDRPEAVRPFLFNLFNDKAIIPAPGPVRWLLARYISWRRAPLARDSYALMGGASPLLPNTQHQAAALEAALADLGEVRCFIAMRYWHPFAGETVREVMAFAPDQVVLLPLYPQYSAATSGSSIADWQDMAQRAGLDVPTRTVCCYPDLDGFIETMAKLTVEAWQRASAHGTPRILLSAHGLPERNIAAGDPYQWQVERSAVAIAAAVTRDLGYEPDWRITYQSRVGRLVWIGPYTETEVEQAAREGRPLVVVPLVFVSEHVETLVELDVEYRHLATSCGSPAYERVRTVNDDAPFIAGLAALVRNALGPGPEVASGGDGRLCPGEWSQCPCSVEVTGGPT